MADTTQELIQAFLYIIAVWLSSVAVTVLFDRVAPFKRRPVSFTSPRREAILGLCLIPLSVCLMMLFRLAFASVLSGMAQSETYSLEMMFWVLIVRGIFFAPFVIALLIRHQGLATIGLSRHNLVLSVFLGLILSGVTVVTYVLVFSKAIVIDSELLSSYLYFFVTSLLAVGFVEEAMFRGYLQLRLATWLGARRGWILTAIVFTVLHAGQSITGLVSVFVTGLVFGWIMKKSENIVGLSIWHAFMDWVWILYKP